MTEEPAQTNRSGSFFWPSTTNERVLLDTYLPAERGSRPDRRTWAKWRRLCEWAVTIHL